MLALLIGLAVSVEMGLKARREAAKSQHVAQFLEDMLEQADPNVAPGRDTTLSPEIADRAAETARTKLADEPEVAMEIEMVLANVYFDLREFDKMAESAQEARRLAAGITGKDSPSYADATGLLARALQGLGKAKEAEITAREAIALQRKARGPGSTPDQEADPPITVLAMCSGIWAGCRKRNQQSIKRSPFTGKSLVTTQARSLRH